jgi:peptide/nickel transport system permease protein
MTQAESVLERAGPIGNPSRVELPGRLWLVARRNPLGTFGLTLVCFMVFMGVFGPFLTADPNAISKDVLQEPSAKHWFGTDSLGRDYFARVVAGARLSLSLSLSAMVIGTTLALIIGMGSAYAKGLVDLVGQRFIDMLLAFPGLILLLLLGQVVGRGWQSVAIGLGLLYAIGLSRIIRATTFSTLAQSYVEAAKVIGASPVRIVLRHVLPNLGPPLLVYLTALIGGAILADGALAFLGLGVPPPAPSWGRMLTEARSQWREPYLSIFPGLAMTITVLGFNLLGDALRDIFDPRLRGSQ